MKCGELKKKQQPRCGSNHCIHIEKNGGDKRIVCIDVNMDCRRANVQMHDARIDRIITISHSGEWWFLLTLWAIDLLHRLLVRVSSNGGQCRPKAQHSMAAVCTS